MDDLISRQTVLESFRKICNICGKDKKYDGVMCRACYLGDAIDIVEELPSVQPESTMGQLNGDGVVNKQEEIIHCKDCKHYEKGWVHCNRVTWWNGKDDFCSMAERRKDG